MDRTFMPTGLPLMPRMHGIALKMIFDKISSYEEMELDRGIEGHMRILPYLSPEDREQLRRIVNACIVFKEKIEPGYSQLMKSKFFIDKFKLNYRTFYSGGLPYFDIAGGELIKPDAS